MYRQIVFVEVLSEQPLPDGSLNMLAYRVTEGDCVGGIVHTHRESISDREMAESLYRLGSEPSFFQLDEQQDT